MEIADTVERRIVTRKGDRAKNIRKLTRKDMENLQPPGVFVDERAPPGLDDVLTRLAPELANGDFPAWFGKRLGTYRAMHDALGETPSIGYELRIVEETEEVILELIRRLQSMPKSVDEDAFLVLWQQQHESWHEANGRAVTMLRNLHSVLMRARRKTASRARNAGRKPNGQRDALVHDVVSKLADAIPGARRGRIYEIAMEVLRACDIQIPSDIEDFRKLWRSRWNNRLLIG